MELESLIGKDVFEIVAQLPNFEWTLQNSALPKKEKLKTLIFVDYDRQKPRKEIDLYAHMDVTKPISSDDVRNLLKLDDKTKISGLTSKVQLDTLMTEFAHIPVLDFDTDKPFSFMSEQDLLYTIKTYIPKFTELKKGVILQSGPKRNYHFIGVGTLLSEIDFITFVGFALGMKYVKDGEHINLVNSRHLGHALSPMKYMAEVENEFETQKQWSRYDFRDRFSTLRMSLKDGYKEYPKVVAVLDEK